MRCLLFFVFSVILLFFKNDASGNCDLIPGFLIPPSDRSFSHKECAKQYFSIRNLIYKRHNLNKQNNKIKINYYDAIQISIFGSGLLIFLMLSFLHLCTFVNYVSFNTELNLCGKKKTLSISTQSLTFSLLNLLGFILLNEYEKEQIFLFIFYMIQNVGNIGNIFNLLFKLNNIIPRVASGLLMLIIFSISIAPATDTLCLIIFQIQCHLYVKRV